MKDLNVLKRFLEKLAEDKAFRYAGPVILNSEEQVLIQEICQEYFDSHDLYWVHDGENKQTLESCSNGFNHEFGEVRKLTIRFAQATNIDKQYYAWRLKSANRLQSNDNSKTESYYFETKQQAIDWVVDFYKSNGYSISAGEQEKC